jgi:hypothetical protein
MSGQRLWLGNGDHPDLEAPKLKLSGCFSFFPTDEALEIAPKGAEFVAAVATSPRPGSDIRDGYFIGPSQSKAWKWVLWDLSYDNEWESWSWIVRATTNEEFADSTKAAAHLLGAVWAWEREKWGNTLFEQVEHTGLLDEDEVWKIGRRALGIT